jgi:hypothetical protein
MKHLLPLGAGTEKKKKESKAQAKPHSINGF